MLLAILQMGSISNELLSPIILMVAFAAGDILLLKLGLTITKSQKRTRMKWVAGSFLIQFGVVFVISSPLFLLGIMGAYQGEGGGLVPIIIFSVFIDFNVINILHQIGLKRSLIIVLLTFAPIFIIIVTFGSNMHLFFK
jgi:hypothetical protein